MRNERDPMLPFLAVLIILAVYVLVQVITAPVLEPPLDLDAAAEAS